MAVLIVLVWLSSIRYSLLFQNVNNLVICTNNGSKLTSQNIVETILVHCRSRKPR